MDIRQSRLDVLMGGESAGTKYGEAVHWMFPDAIPERFAQTKVRRARPESAEGCDVVFSALPSGSREERSREVCRSGLSVVSEASSHRMDPQVPLMIPEVNPEHLKLLETQGRKKGWKGSNSDHTLTAR